MRRALPWAVAVLGLALVVAGVAVFRRADLPAVTYSGSYEPLLPADGSAPALPLLGGAVVWEADHLVGLGLGVLGALVLAAAGGWVLGRRSGRRSAAA